jgi:hypothetical protein
MGWQRRRMAADESGITKPGNNESPFKRLQVKIPNPSFKQDAE